MRLCYHANRGYDETRGQRGLKGLRRRVKQLATRGERGRAWRGMSALVDGLRLGIAQIRGGRRIIKQGKVYYVPLWLPIALALPLASAPLWGDAANMALRLLRGHRQVELAGFFALSVRHWSTHLDEWAARSQVDPQLLATVMQIESCGHPSVVSGAGAQGLFQVMPFHFAEGDDMLDPDTNARRGGDYLNYCSQASGGVIGLTLACYNGGPSVINRGRETWSRETQAYYRWGLGIFSDATTGLAQSVTFDQWLAAGGARLCQSAARELGIAAP